MTRNQLKQRKGKIIFSAAVVAWVLYCAVIVALHLKAIG